MRKRRNEAVEGEGRVRFEFSVCRSSRNSHAAAGHSEGKNNRKSRNSVLFSGAQGDGGARPGWRTEENSTTESFTEPETEKTTD